MAMTLGNKHAELAYQQCTKCVLGTNDDPKISFHKEEIRNCHHQYLKIMKKCLSKPSQQKLLPANELLKYEKAGMVTITTSSSVVVTLPTTPVPPLSPSNSIKRSPRHV